MFGGTLHKLGLAIWTGMIGGMTGGAGGIGGAFCGWVADVMTTRVVGDTMGKFSGFWVTGSSSRLGSSFSGVCAEIVDNKIVDNNNSEDLASGSK